MLFTKIKKRHLGIIIACKISVDGPQRLRHHKLKITRYTAEIARYTMLKHAHQAVNKERARVLRTGYRRLHTDGLNSLHYTLLARTLAPLYTNLTVSLDREASGKPALARLTNNNRRTPG